MAEPITADSFDLVVEVEFVAESGTFTKICGMTDFTITRTKAIDETEVPADCEDETLPYNTKRNTRSRSMTVSGTGIWAQQSHGKMLDWYNGSPAEKLLVRIRHLKAAVGDVETETGTAILQDLNNERTGKQQVTANITLVFDGAIATADKSA